MKTKTDYQEWFENEAKKNLEKEGKEKLSFIEHIQLGRMLKQVNRKILNKLEFRTKKEFKNSHQNKVFVLNDKLRDHLEEVLFLDYPDKAHNNIYYGKVW